MPLSYKRYVRVGELIHRTVSSIVMKMKGLDEGVVTVMSVNLTDDLLSCKIYYSVLGSEEDKKKADIVLKKNTKEVRHQLALHLNLRRTPTISFIYDDTNEKATKVFDILKKIEEEKK
ncbi:30S ribosome-binding factor RbfA [Candidatus Endomicrobiellum agilis]|uniref:30S ribosome-binding factor RbfA n=1 Tax=Candidatus Endomicrobiellum agilis TaxID=3238957 RepID=UPI00283F0F31|nr:30S ribosome-binding factor RbfA [Endomicrobium sp.]MCA6084631.1 30S ribosome-binding factor RbfA [Endomicrobium sp.]MDR3092489.1 30S ribosome-binding factor RbfA [Endomicrobium sp.]